MQVTVVTARLQLQIKQVEFTLSQTCHLVNIRWHSDLKSEDYDNRTTKMLYQGTLKLVKYYGLDATRRSDSNGKKHI